MKRIIDGKAYNTETATKLASVPTMGFRRSEDGKIQFVLDGRPAESVIAGCSTLYQTIGGAYFLVREISSDEVYAHPDSRGGSRPYINEPGLHPLTRKEAVAWAEHRQFEAEKIEAMFGAIPEAGQKAGTIILRVPDALKKRAETAAGDQSVNAWAMRCLEHCADDAELATADSSVLAALDNLIRYAADDESKDFEERQSDNHIYRSIYALAKWRGFNVSDWPTP